MKIDSFGVMPSIKMKILCGNDVNNCGKCTALEKCVKKLEKGCCLKCAFGDDLDLFMKAVKNFPEYPHQFIETLTKQCKGNEKLATEIEKEAMKLYNILGVNLVSHKTSQTETNKEENGEGTSGHIISCKLCQEVVQGSDTALVDHAMNHAERKRFACSRCRTEDNDKKKLKKHFPRCTFTNQKARLVDRSNDNAVTQSWISLLSKCFTECSQNAKEHFWNGVTKE